MPLFIKEPIIPEVPEKTSETAMLIYDKLIEHGGDISEVFSRNYGYPFNWIKWVYNDAKRIEREIFAIIRDNPAVNTAGVLALLSSDYLTVNIIGTDVIHYNPTFDETRNFAEFKAYVLQ